MLHPTQFLISFYFIFKNIKLFLKIHNTIWLIFTINTIFIKKNKK